MNDKNACFIAGLIIGMFAMGLGMKYIGPVSADKVHKLKDKCELNIPRNQSCVMQFVPEKK